jgi:hypothetical protein
MGYHCFFARFFHGGILEGGLRAAFFLMFCPQVLLEREAIMKNVYLRSGYPQVARDAGTGKLLFHP